MKRLHLFYLLRDKEVVKCANALEWAREFESSERQIAQDFVGDIKISTVFLGIDHALSGPPILFETMTFIGEHGDVQIRCGTYDEALSQHRAVVELVRIADAKAIQAALDAIKRIKEKAGKG